VRDDSGLVVVFIVVFPCVRSVFDRDAIDNETVVPAVRGQGRKMCSAMQKDLREYNSEIFLILVLYSAPMHRVVFFYL
jgi:hypothetical protein